MPPGFGYNHPDPKINWEEQELPEGSWEIVGLVSECSEEVAKTMVKVIDGDRYANYCGDYPVWFHTATESLKSLALSNGFTETDLIIKKIEG